MFKFLLWGFLIYLLYRFVFELVLPVSKATGNMRKAMAEMQRRQAEMYQAQQNQAQYGSQQNPGPGRTPPSKADKATDYIDFEEVK